MVSAARALSKAQTSALPFIESAVARGTKATSLYESLQAAGAGVRKQWLLDTYRQYSGIQQAGYAIQNVRHDYFPNYDRLPESITNTFRQYSVNVGISWKGKYADNGTTKIYSSVWVTSDEKHNIQWYLDEAQTFVDESAENYIGDEADLVTPFVIEAKQRNPVFI